MAEKKKDKSDQILSKLEEHDRKFEGIAKKLEEHDRRFGELNLKFDRKTSDLENKFGQKFNDLLTGQDKIIKELESAREDRVLAIGKDREQDRRLDGLEDRTQKLEAKVS